MGTANIPKIDIRIAKDSCIRIRNCVRMCIHFVTLEYLGLST